MQYFYKLPQRVENGHPIIGANSTTFNIADPLSLDSNGFLTTATVGSKIIGWCNESKVTSSTNQTAAKYCPQYIPVSIDVLVVMTADAVVTQAMVANGVYKDFGTITSGSFTIATGAITGGQVKIRGFDPNSDGTTTLAIVSASEREVDAYPAA